MKDLEVARLILVLSLSGLVSGFVPTSVGDPTKRLREIALRHKVDVKKIEAQLKAEEKAKAAEVKHAENAKGNGKAEAPVENKKKAAKTVAKPAHARV